MTVLLSQSSTGLLTIIPYKRLLYSTAEPGSPCRRENRGVIISHASLDNKKYEIKPFAHKADVHAGLKGTHGGSFITVVFAVRFVVISTCDNICAGTPQVPWLFAYWENKTMHQKSDFFCQNIHLVSRCSLLMSAFLAPQPPISTCWLGSGLVHPTGGSLIWGSLGDTSSFSFMSMMSWDRSSSSLKVNCWAVLMSCLFSLGDDLKKDLNFEKNDFSTFKPSFRVTSLRNKKKMQNIF